MDEDPLLEGPAWDGRPETQKEIGRVVLIECAEPAREMLDGKQATDVDPIAERITAQLSPEALAWLAELHLRQVVTIHLQKIMDDAQ
jgi:hypothetical protein